MSNSKRVPFEIVAALAFFVHNSPASAESISGTIRYYGNGAPVSGVTVDLTGATNATTQTDADGKFSFTDLAAGNWRVVPRRSGGTAAAISALDASRVLQEDASTGVLAPEEIIACDVDGTSGLTQADASDILDFKVGTLSSFNIAVACASDWSFVPAPSVVANQTVSAPVIVDLSCQPGAILYEPLIGNAAGQDFHAIVFGDCTRNWPSGAPPSTSTSTATRTSTRTPTRTVTPTSTPTHTATRTPTRTPTRTTTNTPTRTHTRTPTSTPTRSPTRTPTMSFQWPQIVLADPIGGFSSPVHVTHAADGSGRMFVVEQNGLIRQVGDGAIQEPDLLDISSISSCCGERGLLGLAFPPGFESKRYFYVNYTDNGGDTVVRRYHLTDDNVADTTNPDTLITIDQPFSNHNGGMIAFGPNDGYLYIGMGDGGSGGDPQNHGQNPNSLLGKMLRLDTESGATPYGIPADNPNVGNAFPDEIWQLGLRNPWRFSFDRMTGDLYVGDVGQGAYEEIDFQPANSAGGENWGWNIMEGFHCYPPPNAMCSTSGLELPVVEYSHAFGCSVTGGYVYRGGTYPRMHGVYFYSDYCSGIIWGLKNDGGNWYSTQLLDTEMNIVSFGEDEAGNVWVVNISGTIWRITDPNG